jgi:hypothetical protein
VLHFSLLAKSCRLSSISIATRGAFANNFRLRGGVQDLSGKTLICEILHKLPPKIATYRGFTMFLKK